MTKHQIVDLPPLVWREPIIEIPQDLVRHGIVVPAARIRHAATGAQDHFHADFTNHGPDVAALGTAMPMDADLPNRGRWG